MMIGSTTKVFGLFGDPVIQSLSPLMQNTAFRILQLDSIYLPFLVSRESLAGAVNSIRALNLGGVNLTIPHKERVIPYLDQVDEQAGLIGAVNTIVNRDGALCGYNTDASGFLVSLKSAGFNPKGKRAVIMGAGGAARAVAAALAINGASPIHICSRSAERGKRLAQELGRAGVAVAAGGYGHHFFEILPKADLLVNATPVGSYPNQKEKPAAGREHLHPGLLVCDLVYNPPQTRLLAEAAAAGCSVLNGVGMLVHQGALAFQLWTGRKAPVDAMQRVVSDKIDNNNERRR